MRGRAPNGPGHARGGAGHQDPVDARTGPGVQRVSLGRAHVDRRGGHAAPRSSVGPGCDSRTTLAPCRRPRSEPHKMKPPAPRPDWAYFFDIDGTLVDIAEAPGGAGSDGHLRQLIVDLYQAASGAVALISGRSIADIDRLVPGVRLPAAGQHGVERRGAARRISRHASPAPQPDSVRPGPAAAGAPPPR